MTKSTDQTAVDGRARFSRDEEEPQRTEEILDEFEAERPGRKLEGFPARLVAVLAAGLSLFAIFWVFQPLAAQVYRPAFLTVALLLTFIVFGRRKQPSARRLDRRRARGRRHRLRGRDLRRARPPRGAARRRST